MRAEGNEQERAALAGIGQEIRNVEASIDRYLSAFENGSLDERDCGRRVQDLAVKLGQLKGRQEELRGLAKGQPKAPSVEAIERVRRDLVQVLTHGTPGQRKAVIESHVHEIKIDGEMLVPVYKIYVDEQKEEPDDTSTESSFRTLVRVVGRPGLEPGTCGLKVRSSAIELAARAITGYRIHALSRHSVIVPSRGAHADRCSPCHK
jgi:site-specific DNA recombinase